MANDYLGQAGLTALIAKIKTAISTAVSGLLTKSDADGYYQAKGNIPRSDLASDVQTSLGKADTALQSFTETDPVFSASAASGITSTDITNWNNKTSSTGTVTSVAVKMNNAVKGTITTSGTIDLGTVITSHQDITGKADKANVPAATKCKVSYNSQGVITAGSDLSENDIPSLSAYKKRYFSIFDAELYALSFEIPWSVGTYQSTALVYGSQNGYPFVLEVSWSKGPNSALTSLHLSVIYSNNASNQYYVPKVYHELNENSVQKLFFIFTGTSDYRITTEFSCTSSDSISVKTDTTISVAQSKTEYTTPIATNIKVDKAGEAVGSSSVPVFINAGGTAVECGTIPIESGGTGATTAKGASYQIFNDMNESESQPANDARIVFKYANPSAGNGSLYYRSIDYVLQWLKTKISPSDIGAAEKASSGANNLAVINSSGGYQDSGISANSASSAISAVGGKQDALPTSGDVTDTYAVNILGNSAGITRNGYGFYKFDYMGGSECIRIKIPAGKDTGHASLFCTTGYNSVANTFIIGFRRNSNTWTNAPRCCILFGNSNSSNSYKPVVKYNTDSDGNSYLYIYYQSETNNRYFSLIYQGNNSQYINVSRQSEPTGDLSTASYSSTIYNTSVGSAVGSSSTPVYVAASGVATACGDLNAKLWNGYSIKVGSYSSDSNTISFV